MSGTALATLHLYGVDTRHVPAALARMALDRAPLRATPGLRFAKPLGTGDGRTFTVRDADPRRWGLFAVWDDPAALAAFERDSPVARAWRRLAEERWRIDLQPLRSTGRWSGRDPFAGATPPRRERAADDPHTARPDTGDRDAGGDHTARHTTDTDDRDTEARPVAALTRARIRWRQSRRFWRAVPPVSADLNRQPGLRFAVGVGEAPLGLQGTFSVWDTAAALRAFAYAGAQHREAIRRTATEQWYAEELFARFAVLGSQGSVDGRDPVARP